MQYNFFSGGAVQVVKTYHFFMYGLINKTIEELVVSKFGSEKWSEIMDHSETDQDAFISNNYYPDAITLNLVASASKKTGVTIDDLLFAFGEHWILETGLKKYDAILKSGGANLKEFLMHLPSFHSRIMLIYPEITPPDFFVKALDEKSIELKYYSERDGFTPFMNGLLSGLGKLFKTQTKISISSLKREGNDCDTFIVEW